MELAMADVNTTFDLSVRPAHAPDVVVEAAAMRRLAAAMVTDSFTAFQVCAELGLELCGADTCGISLRERTDEGEDIFRWIALAGRLEQHLHGTTPRYFSPCGICVDTGAPVLMRRPELVYKYLDVGVPFHDVLLIPLSEKGSRLEGTIWIVAHNPTRKFDGEDARVMQRLAVFVVTALHLASIAEEAKAETSRQVLLFHELDHRIKNTLAMTAGLLRRQLGSVVDPAARAAIEGATERVMAMGRVHQIGAHVTEDLSEVIRSVCADVVGADTRFELKIEAEPVIIAAHEAAVVSLIVSELITNAMKYALHDRTKGVVTVSLRRTEGDSITLSVTDDGEPMQKIISKGIGLDLVARLAAQLCGELKVDAKPKRFTVVFPAHATQH